MNDAPRFDLDAIIEMVALTRRLTDPQTVRAQAVAVEFAKLMRAELPPEHLESAGFAVLMAAESLAAYMQFDKPNRLYEAMTSTLYYTGYDLVRWARSGQSGTT
ncbi:hypothetical protein [Amycolatopsis sp. BJA-103]|uniref:hypothetical protein n=1 Tax=Amycolatopsis sp. BJA-103 TaxID=1911175 RepID=UPI000C765931|nr:hypothetical protein [Amycolatopsis sp. BJA-103]AUI56768.1 hypothetical protein BKN51_00105 [Amycolatopsis sp. BJA-103]AUI64126.1 hypothetical protein BKN51_42250 [Amycolatopsis sp. BJA-103]PNE13089.1 hypothetical protein B1H26_42410 [Amycolatopsis sp. BJA-103]